jgi:hypothetical protein
VIKELPSVRLHAQTVTQHDGIINKERNNRMIEFLLTMAGLVHTGFAIGHGFGTIMKGNPILGFGEILLGLHAFVMYTKHLLQRK